MKPNIKFVQDLPGLLTAEDYRQESIPKKIRLRIKTTEQGIDILGDSMYPEELETLLRQLDAREIQMILCG
jgi:hypothetical protein